MSGLNGRPAPGYPKCLIAHDEPATELKTRTLTNLYNAHPQRLVDAHAALDAAVALGYGSPEDMSDHDALRKLLTLNFASKKGYMESVCAN